MFDYLALFQEYLTVELGLAKNTQLAYMRDLRLLMKSLQLKADEELLQVSRQQLIAYLVRLKQEGRASSTVARKLASIKAFYRFLTAERYIRRNPAEVLEAASRSYLSFPHQLPTGKTSDNQQNNIVINTYVDNFSMRSE